MIVERDLDCGALYERTRLALVDSVEALTDEQLATEVPASPAWTVRDVVAHVVGITSDLNAGRFPTGSSDEWTAAQVASRREQPLSALLSEWAREAPSFEDGLRLFGYETGCHFLGDLVQHHCDLHHALGLTAPVDSEVRTAALDHYLNAFHDSLLQAGLGGVVVTIDGHPWMLGVDPVVATVAVDAHEALRAFGGRRSEAQLRRLPWTGDVDQVVGLVSPYGLAAEDLLEGSNPRR